MPYWEYFLRQVISVVLSSTITLKRKKGVGKKHSCSSCTTDAVTTFLKTFHAVISTFQKVSEDIEMDNNTNYAITDDAGSFKKRFFLKRNLEAVHQILPKQMALKN